MRSCSVGWGTACLLLSIPVRAQSVEFTARKAEVDLQQHCAELEGDVEVRRGPLRLRAPRLRVQETAEGARVEGPGRLSGCSCAAPPLELAFDSADISRDGDVDVVGPRLVSGETTLFYLPHLMLRGPDSAGILPPKLAYSGRDGAFFGVGAETPFPGASGKKRPRLRVGGGVYSRFERAVDGGRVEVDLSESGGRTRVAYETLDEGMLDIDAFAAHSGRDVAVAFQVDAARGRRALVAPLAFERVIAPQDRARLAVMSWEPGVQAYGQIRGDSVRGAPGVDATAWGGASGFALRLFESDAWRMEWNADVLGMNRQGRRTLGVLYQAVALDGGAAVGPLAVRAGARGVLTSSQGEPLLVDQPDARLETPQTGPGVQLSSGVGFPLSRQFVGWRHWVEPKLSVSAQLAEARWLQAEAGVEQRFGGSSKGQVEAQLELGAGTLVGDFASETAGNYIRADMGASGRWLGLSAELVGLASAADEAPRLAHSERARFGRDSGLHLNVAFDQALGRSWRLREPGADVFASGSIAQLGNAPWASPYAGLGATAGGELWLPLGQRFATSVASVFDLDAANTGGQAPSWLFGSWGGAFRHPCGCLAVQTLLSHRLGRHSAIKQPLQAFDFSLSVELFEPAH